MRCHCHSLSLASVKSRLVLPIWYRLTLVVPDKGPLNGYVCVYVCVCYSCVAGADGAAAVPWRRVRGLEEIRAASRPAVAGTVPARPTRRTGSHAPDGPGRHRICHQRTVRPSNYHRHRHRHHRHHRHTLLKSHNKRVWKTRIHRVKRRHNVYGNDMIAILWV